MRNGFYLCDPFYSYSITHGSSLFPRPSDIKYGSLFGLLHPFHLPLLEDMKRAMKGTMPLTLR